VVQDCRGILIAVEMFWTLRKENDPPTQLHRVYSVSVTAACQIGNGTMAVFSHTLVSLVFASSVINIETTDAKKIGESKRKQQTLTMLSACQSLPLLHLPSPATHHESALS
jgi:hypothetical protein